MINIYILCYMYVNAVGNLRLNDIKACLKSWSPVVLRDDSTIGKVDAEKSHVTIVHSPAEIVSKSLKKMKMMENMFDIILVDPPR